MVNVETFKTRHNATITIHATVTGADMLTVNRLPSVTVEPHGVMVHYHYHGDRWAAELVSVSGPRVLDSGTRTPTNYQRNFHGWDVNDPTDLPGWLREFVDAYRPTVTYPPVTLNAV